MNRWQKIAWYNIIVITTALLLTGITVAILTTLFGMPKALGGLGVMGLCGFAGLSPVLFRKKQEHIEFDERDQLINQKAALAGFGIAFLVTGLACMLPFFILGPNSSMSIFWLPMIFGATGLTMYIAHSITILIQYGKGGKDG